MPTNTERGFEGKTIPAAIITIKLYNTAVFNIFFFGLGGKRYGTPNVLFRFS